MKNNSTHLILVLAALLPLNAVLAEPVNNAPGWTIDLTLPIHQKPKLHPEISDPVLGDQAQIVEWAWSPQYAERFGLQPQSDGLPNGGLWLIGVKVQRIQSQQWQRYTCNIVGVMDNTLPIITPPGERYTITPGYRGMPGMRMAESVKEFTPGQAAWIKNPKNKREEIFPAWALTLSYLQYYKYIQPDLAFFEVEGACGYFQNSATHRNEIGFPTGIEALTDADKHRSAYLRDNAIKFNIPDGLMSRIYPYTSDADDWTSCLMRRVGDKSHVLSLRAIKSKRFGNACEPSTKQPK
jgi:hypothetical protein